MWWCEIRVISLVVASPLHEPSRLSEYVASFVSQTRDLPFAGVFTEPARLDSSAAVAMVATGGTEHIVLETAKRSGFRYVVLAYHDSENSLPAIMEVVPELRRWAAVDVVRVDEVGEYARAVLRACEAASSLAKAKVLAVGGPSPWLVYSSGVEELLRDRLGVEVEHVELSELYEELGRVGRALPGLAELGVPPGLDYPAPEDLKKILGVYLALRGLASKRGARAVTLRCFDLIKDLGVTACLPLSRLLDEGIVAGCEGDLPAVVTMLMLKEVSRRPPWMANVVHVGNGVVELAHCTVAASIATSFRLVPHFESEAPAAVAGEFKVGAEVTIAKYDPKKNILRAAAGRILEGSPRHARRCRTQMRVAVPAGFSRRLLEDPLGAHLVASIGDVTRELEVLAKLVGLNHEIYRWQS